MTKEEIDVIIQGIERVYSSEDIQHTIDTIKDFCILSKTEDIWEKMQKHIDGVLQENEEEMNEFVELSQQLMGAVHSQIPENFLDYYYFELTNKGLGDFCFSSEQKKKAEEIYDKKIEEIIDLDENERIEESKKINKPEAKIKILQTLSDDKKLEILDTLGNSERILIASSISDSEIKLKTLDKIEDSGKILIAKTINNPDIKIKALDKIPYSERSKLVLSIEDPQKRLEILSQLDEKGKLEVVLSVPSLKRLEVLPQLDSKGRLKVALSLDDPLLLLQARDMVETKDRNQIIKSIETLIKKDEEEKSVLKRLYYKNPDILKKIDYRLLDKRYIETLGEEAIATIAIRPAIQEQLLALDDKKYDLFCKCLNTYLETTQTEDYRPVVDSFLKRMQTGEYDELIQNIEENKDVDYKKLSIILQKPNVFNITTVEDIENFEEIKRKKCDEIINGRRRYKTKKRRSIAKAIWTRFGIC